jgi:hypothetical protein
LRRGCAAERAFATPAGLCAGSEPSASRGTRVEPGDVIGSGACGTGCILELSMARG